MFVSLSKEIPYLARPIDSVLGKGVLPSNEFLASVLKKKPF